MFKGSVVVNVSLWVIRIAFAFLGTVAIILAFSDSLAFGARGYVLTGEFGRIGGGNGEFERPLSIAVNESNGTVYVLDQEHNRVEWFNAEGQYQGQFDGTAVGAEHFHRPEYLAIDNSSGPSAGDVYVATSGHNAGGGNIIDKFDSMGNYIGRLESLEGSPFSVIAGLAVDVSGNLWIYEENGNIDECHGAGICERRLETEPGAGNHGIAIDSHDNIYTLSGAERLQEYNSHFERVKSQEIATGDAAAIGTEDKLFLDERNRIVEYGPFGSPIIPIQAVEGLVESYGVAVNRKSDTIYATEREAGRVKIFAPEPEAEPVIDAEWSGEIASTAATLDAQIDPKGVSTEYRFEYGPTVAYGSVAPLPDAVLGAEFEEHKVSVRVQSLTPSTTYHYRVVAHNALGTAYGEGHEFVTQPAEALQAALPDGRAWELVSPPNKGGFTILGIEREGGLIQAAAEGGAFTYLTTAPTETGVQGSAEEVQVLSRRGPEGWSSRDLATPHDTSTDLSGSKEYQFFSEDLSVGLVEPQGPYTQLSPLASERTSYLRREALCDSEITAGECYSPLLTSTPGYADVPSGVKFGGNPAAIEGVVHLQGATSDLNHVIIGSPVALTEVPTGAEELYEWSRDKPAAEQLQLISLLPEDKGPSSHPAELGVATGTGGNRRHVISSDGSRVFWTAAAEDGHHLYMRDTTLGESVMLDAVVDGAGTGEPHPIFQTASADGSKAFFTDKQQLTAGSEGGDLYECEIRTVSEKLACILTDLTPPRSAEAADVKDIVTAGSEDGSSLYFVATGVLSTVKNERGEEAASGADNLYLLRYDDSPGQEAWEPARFVATLSPEDNTDWAGVGGSEESAEVGSITAQASHDGRYLAFMSDRSLTGYDTLDANTGKPDQEVYLYDATAGRIVCVSCNRTGARPLGVQGTAGSGLVDRIIGDAFLGRGFAANLPGWTPFGKGHEAVYQSRYLSSDGRLFFNSNDALVPQDTNGNEDVYEYEPVNVGDCSASSPSFEESSDGCVALISSGKASGESAFLDASEGGAEVFFLTGGKLVAQDAGTAIDVYDAHICTTLSPCTTAPVLPAPCTTADSCRTTPSPQPSIFGLPPSATFAGAGQIQNGSGAPTVKSKALTRKQKLAAALRACRAERKRKRTACERLAKKRYAPKSHRASAKKKGGR